MACPEKSGAGKIFGILPVLYGIIQIEVKG